MHCNIGCKTIYYQHGPGMTCSSQAHVHIWTHASSQCCVLRFSVRVQIVPVSHNTVQRTILFVLDTCPQSIWPHINSMLCATNTVAQLCFCAIRMEGLLFNLVCNTYTYCCMDVLHCTTKVQMTQNANALTPSTKHSDILALLAAPPERGWPLSNLEYLLSVLPKISAGLLPEHLRSLVTTANSSVASLYPNQYMLDTDGARCPEEQVIQLARFDIDLLVEHFREAELGALDVLGEQLVEKNSPGEVLILQYVQGEGGITLPSQRSFSNRKAACPFYSRKELK